MMLRARHTHAFCLLCLFAVLVVAGALLAAPGTSPAGGLVGSGHACIGSASVSGASAAGRTLQGTWWVAIIAACALVARVSSTRGAIRRRETHVAGVAMLDPFILRI